MTGSGMTALLRKPSMTIAIAQRLVPALTADEYASVREGRGAIIGTRSSGYRFQTWV